jgi:ketopantoate reductase
VLGCVVHISCSTPEPGLVQHKMGQGLIVGEPRGAAAAAAPRRVVELLAQAGFDATHAADVRYDIWYKLWGNLTMNPVSAITGATIDRVLDDPLVRAFCSQAMQEAAAVGARIGVPIAQSAEDRHAVTRKLGAFKTSMLQDVEAGRADRAGCHRGRRARDRPSPGPCHTQRGCPDGTDAPVCPRARPVPRARGQLRFGWWYHRPPACSRRDPCGSGR